MENDYNDKMDELKDHGMEIVSTNEYNGMEDLVIIKQSSNNKIFSPFKETGKS